MPTYEVEDPKTGKTVELEGDSPPTEQELEEIFADLEASAPESSAAAPVGQDAGLVGRTIENAKQAILAPAADFLGGVKEGVLGGAQQENPSTLRTAGKVMGKDGPAAAGSAVGAMGGAALGPLGAAAAAGLGAAAGEALRMDAAMLFGTEAPTDSQQAALKLAKVAGTFAATEAGVGLVGTIASKLTPGIAQVFLKMPAEAIKRAIAKPSIINAGGPAARAAVDRRAFAALKELQSGLSFEREQAGKAVESALNELQRATGGAKFDVGALADDLLKKVEEKLSLADTSVRVASGNDLKQVIAILKDMKKNPMKDAKAIVNLRRQVDSLTKYNQGNLPKISGYTSEVVAGDLAGGLRDFIKHDLAMERWSKPLLEANERFSNVAKAYDETRQVIGSKDASPRELASAVRKINGLMAKNDAEFEAFASLAQDFPKLRAPMERLLDSSASIIFNGYATGTPSGAYLNVIRLLGAPRVVGAGIKAAPAARPAVAPAAAVGINEVSE